MKKGVFTILVLVISLVQCFSVTYTSTGPGTWDKVMPATILAGDILNVSHTGMTASVPHNFGFGGGQINVTGGDLTLNPVTGSFFQLTVNVSGGGTLGLGSGSFSISQGTWNVVGGHLDFSGITGSMTFNPTSATGSPASVTVPTVIPIATVTHTNINGKGGNTWAKFVADWSPTPLPIELLSFSAAYDNNVVTVSWSTASEKNNDFFEIQKRDEFGEFSSIVRIKGAGTSLSQLDYQMIDESPNDGVNYYRLIQYDFDGSFSISNIIAVETSLLDVKVYPNPVQDLLYIEHGSEKVNFVLYNNRGEELMMLKDINNTVQIPTSELYEGLYFVELQTGQRSIKRKIVIVH